jgi:DNA-binding transcriptional regulator YiaG
MTSDTGEFRDWADVRAELLADPDTAAAYDQAATDLEQYEAHATASLAQLRKARALTQVQMSRAMGISQGEVSRIERQADLLLSTLASYITAIGGRLVIGIEPEPGAPLIELDLDALHDDEEPVPAS